MLNDELAVSETDFEYPACPACQSEQRKVRYAKFGSHQIMQCADCNLHYLYPRLTETAMRAVYASSDYFEGGESGYSDAGYSSQERALRATFRRLMQNLKKRGLTGGSLLEVGCGYGYLLEEAKEYYSHRVGTDYSSQAVETASAKADKIYQGGIEEIPSDLKFDCVIATHVIEHVYEPHKFIKNIISHTKKGGKIVLAAPDMGGLLRKVMGRSWPSFKIPEHVIYFDFKTLSEMMQKAGLTKIQPLPYPHAFPLALITSKFRLPVPAAVANANIWVPATTVAACGTVSEG